VPSNQIENSNKNMNDGKHVTFKLGGKNKTKIIKTKKINKKRHSKIY